MIVVSGRDNDFEVATVAFLALTGGLSLLPGVPTSSTVSRMLPGVWAEVFFGALLVGGVIALVGLYLPLRYVAGPMLEGVGLLMLSFQLGAYGVSVLLVNGARGLVSVALCFAIAWACGRRVCRVVRAVWMGVPR